MGKFTMYLLAVSAVCLTVLAQAGAENQYQRVARDLHNQYRQRHRVGNLRASADLNRRAVQCAQYYARKGTIDHSCPHKNGAGENLFAQWGGSPTDANAARSATNGWYAEVSKHNYNGDWQPASGHFTQLVWKASKDFGFGTARSGNMIVGVALYSTHGNILGQFRNNVLRP